MNARVVAIIVNDFHYPQSLFQSSCVDRHGGGSVIKGGRGGSKIGGARIQKERRKKMRMGFLQGGAKVMERTDPFAREKFHEFGHSGK